jgi:hypothetical protein
MKKFYYNNKIDWTAIVVYIVLMPFKFILRLFYGMFNILKRFIIDVARGVYKKIVEIFVLAFIVFVVFILSKYNL